MSVYAPVHHRDVQYAVGFVVEAVVEVPAGVADVAVAENVGPAVDGVVEEAEMGQFWKST